MNSSSLLQDIATLTESLRTAFQQIARFSKLGTQQDDRQTQVDIVNERDETEDEDSSDSLIGKLASLIHETLKQNEESLELLNQEVENVTKQIPRVSGGDSEVGRQSVQLVARLGRLGEDVKHARGQFRKAQLTVQRAVEARKRQERETLFEALQNSCTAGEDQGADDKKPQRTLQDLFAGRRKKQNKDSTQDELLIDASNDITLSLRRTHEQLLTELSRSRFAQETLDQSTAQLAELGQRYSSLDDLLSSSKNLLGTLIKSQKSDTWYLETAFYILCITLGWLFFRRIIYGPTWWFFWLPLRNLLLRPLYWVISSLGVSSAATASVAATVSTRAPLKVQPSATGGIPRFETPRYQMSVPAGAGGGGAKAGDVAEESLADRIGRMSEQGESSVSGSQGDGQEQQTHHDDKGGEQPVKRGDGHILEERDQVKQPRNPKKKPEIGLEEPPADHAKDEL